MVNEPRKVHSSDLEMKKYFLPALPFLWASSLLTFQELGTGIGFGFRLLKGMSTIAFVINRITKPDIFFHHSF